MPTERLVTQSRVVSLLKVVGILVGVSILIAMSTGTVAAAEDPFDTNSSVSQSGSDIQDTTREITRFLTYIILGMSGVLFVYGAGLYMLASDSVENASRGKQQMKRVVVGVVAAAMWESLLAGFYAVF
jgi:hypothetical protein